MLWQFLGGPQGGFEVTPSPISAFFAAAAGDALGLDRGRGKGREQLPGGRGFGL